MSDSYPCSVVLAAHGSLAETNGNQPVVELAERVAASGIFSLVTPAFLNGHPKLNRVFELLPPGDTIVVPLMTSEGYYSKTVLPGKLAENLNLDRYRVFLTPALGVQPEIVQLVGERILTMMSRCQLQPDDTTIVLIGHGTPRHTNSGASTNNLAAGIENLLPDLTIEVAFIDQQPVIQELIPQIRTPHRLVVPFLISCGPHATVDVPEAFGLPTGPQVEFPIIDRNNGNITICDLPVGMYPEISDVCLELATNELLGGSPVQLSKPIEGRPA